MTKKIITRFAPSPTGYLHIGGARTALFNWLFAKANDGKFLIRIEDTDRERSTQAATDAIFDGLTWLGLEADEEPIFQFSRAKRHKEVAETLLEKGMAFKCFATQEEIQTFRENARAEGHSTRFISPWRDGDKAAKEGQPYSIRIKAPLKGETSINDAVQGKVTWKNETLDDLIILRSDGTPTYMLAVVVDDHDMQISHVIRGDDHLTNAARQSLIYDAMEWERPIFAHISLIHGADGKKLSKRHGALGVDAYRDMGYPAIALKNYLARLGWAHGDLEYFDMEKAIEHFTLDGVNTASARLDLDKLDAISSYHINHMSASDLIDSTLSFIDATKCIQLSADFENKFTSALPLIREKSKKIDELIDSAGFILKNRPITFDEKAQKTLTEEARSRLDKLTLYLENVRWSAENLELAIKEFIQIEEIGLGKIAMPIRAALTGTTKSPSVFEMMEILGKDEVLARLKDAIDVG